MTKPLITDMSLETAERLINDADALRRAGQTPDSIRRQWIESGVSESTADVLLEVLTEDLPRQRRRATVKLGASIVAVPLVIIGLIFAIVFIVNASKGPDARQMASDALFDACGSRLGTPGAIELDGEVVLVGGTGLTGGWITRATDENFASIMLDDNDELAADRALCGSVDNGATTTCDGYYSQEVIDAIENSLTLEDALASLTAHDEFGLLRSELLNGGQSVRVQSAALAVELNAIDGHAIAATTVPVPAECPDTHLSRGFGTSTERSYPDAQDTATAIFELTGIEL